MWRGSEVSDQYAKLEWQDLLKKEASKKKAGSSSAGLALLTVHVFLKNELAVLNFLQQHCL